MPHSDEAREQMAQLKAERAARVGRVAPALEYALDAVTVGWYIRSTTRRYADDLDDVGGVVVDVERFTYVDPETGELTPDCTRYRCLDTRHPWAGARPWQYLDAAEVALPLSGLDRAGATAAGYWLLRRIPARSRVARPPDVDLVHDVWRLWSAAAQL